MRNVFILLYILILSNKLCFGINLKKLDKQLGNIKVSENFVKSETNNLVQKFEKTFDTKLNFYENKILKIIDKAEKNINEAIELKNKVQYYIKIAKIIGVIFSFLSLGLLFFLFRIWRNIVNFKKLLKVTLNYEKFEKRIEILEKEIENLKNQ